MTDPERPAPTAQGTLTKRPLAHLLAYAAEKKLSGSLVFGDPSAPAGAVVVKEGEPTKAACAGHVDAHGMNVWDSLADLPGETAFAYFEAYDALADHARDDVPSLDAVFRTLRRRPPDAHVEAALARLGGAAIRVDPTIAFAGLGLDAGGLAALETLRQGAFTLEAVRAVSELRDRAEILVYGLLITKAGQVVASGAASPIAPIASSSGLPEVPSSSELPAAAPSSSEVVPDSSEPKAAVARVRLARTSQRLTPLKEEPTVISSYDDRASISPVPPVAVPLRAPAPMPARQATASPLVKVSSTAGIAARRKEILDRAATIDAQNYFEMLGIPQDTPTPQVQAAFIGLAKKWHPDRLPIELSDVREACSRVFSRLSEASSTLCDEEHRKDYMRLLSDGGATPEDQDKITMVLEAAMAFQKAEVMLKRGDVAKAEELCAVAVRLDAQPDYVALLAWIESLKPANQSAEATRRLESTLTSAIEKSERCERAVFYRGTLRKRLGDNAGAMDDFRRAFELNPRNLDAQREVRLNDMRHGKPDAHPGSSDAKPGFIGRLFKK